MSNCGRPRPLRSMNDDHSNPHLATLYRRWSNERSRGSVEKTSIRPVGHCPTNMYGEAARPLDLLGRAEPSSPTAALRRAEGAGLDGESADRAIIKVMAMP